MNLTRNIWCVGRNYAEHAVEMKAEVPKTPLIFLKSGNCLNLSSKIKIPPWTAELHYELEIALLFDEDLSFSHLTLALDLTARDAQSEAKKKGQPWTLAKSFTDSCPIGQWFPTNDISDFQNLQFQLLVNDQVAQIASAHEMIFNPQMLKTHLLQYFPVQKHDVLLTGTPSGVGALQSGDRLSAEIWEKSAPHKKILICNWDVE